MNAASSHLKYRQEQNEPAMSQVTVIVGEHVVLDTNLFAGRTKKQLLVELDDHALAHTIHAVTFIV